MAEYIEREAVLKIIGDNCPHDKCGYNTEEEMEAGAACYYIMKDVDNIPTADVVPRAEAENYKSIAEHQQKLSMERYFEIKQLKQELDKAKREVIEEYRQRVNVKMGKHTHLLGKEYVQRILREVAKEMKGESK